jgi:hypothetical protein
MDYFDIPPQQFAWGTEEIHKNPISMQCMSFYSYLNMSSLENRRKNKVLDERLLKPSDPFEGPVGSLVWGKLKSYPWWPGMFINMHMCVL